ncbi:hypothetical protein THRCLA_09005, partial [Thraustotheca clavata]
MSSFGDLVPIGKKEDKKKSNDLTSGLISIGGKKSAVEKDDIVDDFDLDDLLSDTTNKKSDESSGKSKKKSKSKSKSSPKSKDKKNKKKDKTSHFALEDSTELGTSQDTFSYLDKPTKMEDDFPKDKKGNMQNLDEEFAKALGFDESEFRSAVSPEKYDIQAPAPVIQDKVVEPSPPIQDKYSISSSFFEDDSATKVKEDVNFTSDRRGRGRRGSNSAFDDNEDPFAKKPAKIDNLDLFGSSSRRQNDTSKAEESSKPTIQKEEAPIAEDVPAFPWMKKKAEPQITPTPDTSDTPTFPWMKKKQEQSEKVNDDEGKKETPNFPWMKKKQDTEQETKSNIDDPPKSDMPSFPWTKPKAEAPKEPTVIKQKTPPKASEDDLPSFPWMKKKTSEPTPIESPLSEPLKRQDNSLQNEKANELPQETPRLQLKPEPIPETVSLPSPPRSVDEKDLEPTSSSPEKPDITNTLTVETSSKARSILFKAVVETTTVRPASPPRRTSIETLSSPPSSPQHRAGNNDKVSSPKPSVSPPRVSSYSPTTEEVSPHRLSPASRGTFLDNTTIVPAFISHQLEESQSQIASLETQLQTNISEKNALQAAHDEVVEKLNQETQRTATLTVELASATTALNNMKNEVSLLQADKVSSNELVGALRNQSQAMTIELTTFRAQAATSLDLQAQINQMVNEKAMLKSELDSIAAKLAQAQRELVHEQSLHIQSVERFKRLEHEREQEALQQQRWRDEENRHAEKEAVERLLTQVRAAVSNLKGLQENVAFGKTETEARMMGENESRSRLLMEMEGSCKAYMTRTQEECHRLQALLSTLETTMRTLRGEHMEEKERLRCEQARLEELAMHFKSQTALLQERTDTNTKVVSQTLASYIQDIRIAEARMHKRREQIQEEERSLHMARATFAAQQEEALRDQRMTQERNQLETKRVEEKLFRLRSEKKAFEELIDSYASEMEALEDMQRHLDEEKIALQEAAQTVEAMAEKVKAASEASAASERNAAHEKQQASAMLQSAQDERLLLSKKWSEIEERERRLQEEIRYMDTARRKLTQERSSVLNQRRQSRQPLASSEPTQFERQTPISQYIPPTKQQRYDKPIVNQTYTSLSDPTGLSPAFRNEMEQFWKQAQLPTRSSSQLSDRMFMACVGLDHSKYTPRQQTFMYKKPPGANNSFM